MHRTLAVPGIQKDRRPIDLQDVLGCAHLSLREAAPLFGQSEAKFKREKAPKGLPWPNRQLKMLKKAVEEENNRRHTNGKPLVNRSDEDMRWVAMAWRQLKELKGALFRSTNAKFRGSIADDSQWAKLVRWCRDSLESTHRDGLGSGPFPANTQPVQRQMPVSAGKRCHVSPPAPPPPPPPPSGW